MSTFKMLVGGKLVESPETFGVINPSTAEVFAQCPDCTQDTCNEAISSAKNAFKTWRLTSFAERKACLEKAIKQIEAKTPEIMQVLTKEQGKPIGVIGESQMPEPHWSSMMEMAAVGMFLGYFANLEVPDKVLSETDDMKVVEKNVPLGVVGGITPWNFPPLMAAWKIGEAVMTGNTIVLKPSPYTPLSTLMLSECFLDTFPAGVVNILGGGNQVGEWITKHPDIAKISFTGSILTGKAIQAVTSGTLKRLTLELGGNDAAIVLEGADVKKTAAAIFDKAMMNTGQVCVAVKRCFVPQGMHDEFLQELTTLGKDAEKAVGDGFAAGVKYGPINNKMQFDKVSELVEDAKKSGAKIHCGGAPCTDKGKGYFYPPTIISGVKEGVRIVDEEQFGPVLPVMPYSDVTEAVNRANHTLFGLGGSVWGPVEKANEIAAMMDAGSIWVNDHADLGPDVPFGGRKESGVGRQMGSATIDGYTDKIVLRLKKEKKVSGGYPSGSKL